MPLRRMRSFAVIERNPVAIGPCRDIGHPLLIVEIPTNSFLQTSFKCFLRTPADIALNSAGVDRIAPIMARTIRHEGDLFLIRSAVGARPFGIENGADEVYDRDVAFLAGATDIVDGARPPVRQHGAKRRAMISDIDPIADIQAVAINRDFPAIEGAVDGQRNQLFRELAGPIVIRAIGGDDRQAVGVMERANQMIGASLACGVWTIGSVRRGFAKRRVGVAERAIYFVG